MQFWIKLLFYIINNFQSKVHKKLYFLIFQNPDISAAYLLIVWLTSSCSSKCVLYTRHFAAGARTHRVSLLWLTPLIIFFVLRLCTSLVCSSLPLSLSLSPSLSLLCILSWSFLCLSVFLCLWSTSPFFPVGLWIRVGRVVLDPHRGPVTAGVVLALGVGRGPVAVTAFEAWWRGAARLVGGRRSRATCMPEACGLASEWHMVTGVRMRGNSGHNCSMVWISSKSVSL